MAMEDAVCLSAEAEAASGDMERALPVYNAKRYLRTSRVQLQSRLIGEHIYHPADAHADLRNAIMKARTPEDWYDAVDWLYGSTGLEGAACNEMRR